MQVAYLGNTRRIERCLRSAPIYLGIVYIDWQWLSRVLGGIFLEMETELGAFYIGS